MGKSYLTADWHVGESTSPGNASFLRPLKTKDMVEQWLAQANRQIRAEDTLIFGGDSVVDLESLAILARLPKCKRLLVLGDKETSGKYLKLRDFLDKNAELGIFDKVVNSAVVKVAGRSYFVSHKPLDCLRQKLPAICGHVHGIWRTSQMPSGEPIINVGVDAWGGIVSEEMIEQQYRVVKENLYDDNCFPHRWHR